MFSLYPSNSGFLSHSRVNPLSVFIPNPKLKLFSHLHPIKYQFGNEGFDSIEKEEEKERGKGKEKAVNGIHVARQKYIDVPKKELLGAIVRLFDSDEDADDFKKFAAYLDYILHAEHKSILEKMRLYYSLSQSEEEISEEWLATEHEFTSANASIRSSNKENIFGRWMEDDRLRIMNNGLDLRNLLKSFTGINSSGSVLESRVAMAPEFQKSFMKLLSDAQFEELSAQDLMLTYALNSDYLLTLPIYVNWKKAAESNAIIFRRGYTTERESGLLIVEKLDYLQSKLLQEIFFSISWPLKTTGNWLKKVLKESSEGENFEKWIENLKVWLKGKYSLDRSLSFGESPYDNQLRPASIEDSDLPIWLAAQKAIPRYEGFLSSIGPRGRLVRKLLNTIGFLPSMSEPSTNVESDSKNTEAFHKPNFLRRITLSNIWEPATVNSCGYNVWNVLKTSISILFSKSTLQEPAFQELILFYNESDGQSRSEDKMKILPLQLKIYEKIPIPDLPVIFPHKKLSFRILDTVRLDIASILGLLAFLVNYKFENIASSPSAFLLDLIATSALIIYVSRVALGYKQTWDRYQLLVNKTLYEKTVASGFGSVYFLLDASEQQKYKEAILVYGLLLHSKKHEVCCRRKTADACERFIYENFNKKIEMPIDSAMDTLLRLETITESSQEERNQLKVVPCAKAYATLKQRWDALLSHEM